MEKIFIFIIIMIVSSFLSKNKKKKASRAYEEKNETKTHFNNSVTSAPKPQPKPVQDLRDLLNTLKNFDPKNMSAKIDNTESKPLMANEPEIQSTEKLESRFAFKEQNSEAYSFNESKKSYDPTAKSYSDVAVYDEKSSNYNEDQTTKKRVEPKIDKFEMLLKQDKKTVFKEKYFDSKSKLKNAIIVSEILKSKYV